MTSRPSRPSTHALPPIPSPAIVALLLAAAISCGDGHTQSGRTTPSASETAASTVAPTTDAPLPGDEARASAAPTLTGRLIDEVVSDSALQASWALEPLERHIGIVHARIGDTHYLLADSLVGYDGAKAQWRIRQAQAVSAPRAGEAWVTSCVLAGTDTRDGTIVARVTLTPDDSLPTPHDAWRLDPIAWRFSPYPAAALSCFNEGGGP